MAAIAHAAADATGAPWVTWVSRVTTSRRRSARVAGIAHPAGRIRINAPLVSPLVAWICPLAR